MAINSATAAVMVVATCSFTIEMMWVISITEVVGVADVPGGDSFDEEGRRPGSGSAGIAAGGWISPSDIIQIRVGDTRVVVRDDRSEDSHG